MGYSGARSRGIYRCARRTIRSLGRTPFLWIIFFSLGVAVARQEIAAPPEPASAASTTSTDDDARIASAQHLIRVARGDRALEALGAISITERSADLEIMRAGLLIQERQQFDAATLRLKALLLRPLSPTERTRALAWRAFAALRRGASAEAIIDLENALVSTPDDPIARFNLGRAYLAKERYAEALDCFELAEARAPDLWLLSLYRGRTLATVGRSAEALAAYDLAEQKDPDRLLTRLYRGVLLRRMGQRADVRALTRELLTRDSQYDKFTPPPFGYFYVNEDESELANAVRTIVGQDDPALAELAERFFLRKAIDSRNPDPLAALLRLKAAIRDDANGETLTRLLGALPSDVWSLGYGAHLARAEALRRIGRFAEAVAASEAALALRPMSARALFQMALILRQMKDATRARKLVDAVLALQPEYALARRWNEIPAI